MSDQSIIEKAENFFYFEDHLCESIEQWAVRHCDTFETRNSEDQEQPLEHMSLYEDYVRLFEALVESFLVSENISLEQFYKTVRNDYETAQRLRKESSTFTSILLGSLEFAFFCELMYNVKIGQGVVFCPPLVSEVEVATALANDTHDAFATALPKREAWSQNECKYLHKSEPSEKDVEHKSHK